MLLGHPSPFQQGNIQVLPWCSCEKKRLRELERWTEPYHNKDPKETLTKLLKILLRGARRGKVIAQQDSCAPKMNPRPQRLYWTCPSKHIVTAKFIALAEIKTEPWCPHVSWSCPSKPGYQLCIQGKLAQATWRISLWQWHQIEDGKGLIERQRRPFCLSFTHNLCLMRIISSEWIKTR